MIELRDKNGNIRFSIYRKGKFYYRTEHYWIVKEYPLEDNGEAVGLTQEQFIDLLERYWNSEF